MKSEVSVRYPGYKCMVLTNGIYASEVWNYTRAGMDRLEKHYFWLLQKTMLLANYATTTYITVLDEAREQGVVKLYPLEQLKFLWKILHLDDTALQRIVLHSKMDSQFSRGRGGRQRTYKQCIKDAMGNVGVSMAQCMDMEQQEWDLRIEGVGLEAAVQQWKTRPNASKPIDREWRTPVGRGTGGKTSIVGASDTAYEANSGDEDSDEDNNEESDAESVTEDECTQFPDSQEEKDARADKETPWDEVVHAEEGQGPSAHVRVGTRSRHSHGNGSMRRGECNVEQSATQGSTVAKRARTSEGRHCQREKESENSSKTRVH
eukprot:gene23426-31771_t